MSRCGCCCAGLMIPGVPNDVPDPPPLCRIPVAFGGVRLQRGAESTGFAVTWDNSVLLARNDEAWDNFVAAYSEPFDILRWTENGGDTTQPWYPGHNRCPPNVQFGVVAEHTRVPTNGFAGQAVRYREDRLFCLIPLVHTIGGTQYDIKTLYGVSALSLRLTQRAYGNGYYTGLLEPPKSFPPPGSTGTTLYQIHDYTGVWTTLDVSWGVIADSIVNTASLAPPFAEHPYFIFPAASHGLLDLATTSLDTGVAIPGAAVGSNLASTSPLDIDISSLTEEAGGDFLLIVCHVTSSQVLKQTPTMSGDPADVVVSGTPVQFKKYEFWGPVANNVTVGPSSAAYKLVEIWGCILSLNTRIVIEQLSSSIVEENRLKLASYLSGTNTGKRFKSTDNTVGTGGGGDTEEFTSSGTFTLPIDAAVTIECWGAGGDGGIADHLAGYGGGGGGGGAYAKAVMNLTAGNYTVTIDGTGASFINTGTLLAENGADGTSAALGGFGGAGGTASGTALDVGYAGGDGGIGDIDVNGGLGGGGGSSAGTASAGDDGESGETSTGAGGTAPTGGGNGGNGSGFGGNPPTNGSAPGGGGGGGGDLAAGVPGVGGAAKIIISYGVPAAPDVNRSLEIYLSDVNLGAGTATLNFDVYRQSDPNDSEWYLEHTFSEPIGTGTDYETVADITGAELTAGGGFSHDGDNNATPANGTEDATVKITIEHVSISNTLP